MQIQACKLTPTGTMSTRSHASMPLPTSAPRKRQAMERPRDLPVQHRVQNKWNEIEPCHFQCVNTEECNTLHFFCRQRQQLIGQNHNHNDFSSQLQVMMSKQLKP